MAKVVNITLDGQDFVVPALNIGQLESLTAAFEGPKSAIPFSVLRIAMARSTPQTDIANMTPTMDEVSAAVHAILETAGLQKADANPPHLTVVAKND